MAAPGGTTGCFLGFPLAAGLFNSFLFQAPLAAHLGFGLLDRPDRLLPGPFGLAQRLVVLSALETVASLGEQVTPRRTHNRHAVTARP